MKFEPLNFQWDEGNQNKNWQKHQVSKTESEEIFFDNYKIVINDFLHSDKEKRWILFGKTKQKRILYTVFTIRKKIIRIISARDANKKEKKLYEKKARNSKIQK
ncbi:hypothetical protein CO009_02800 [Candidatus Shapirobacteria bacterium CG_4_8_14_3_um_filter_35_11]|uniref:Toxin n=6 Tax=Candidatus Shapironibacteriota TaxID=1752721 RepID=A0A1J5HZE2_9BACT|nr:MAG: hypothetical protein AUK05_01790 [Candidatus Shapirobacteria bacterium CG2_30_35_20]PIV06725.1 MAG: hypothetical protein COS53_03825 [Candidatus Shapirobacteria bacterium CG03_land_8_20_14_0_80_35_14]PIX68062.1 MAG: hypothetical protein COZ41_01705 [Candidatus Shapirobacteria bacterium CG_4_10_14_3_um_filter_35_13]PJA50772.1 MAG: hypothetical protein CO168_03335 [Candidatus Shapirobacteria bacterium CG_4_9_14_3_um_filter_36_12]PJC80092.1 MAG: hypothetical protein CO009_02800 [Candidatus